MTDTICTTLESENGIENAYSWPTGERNAGPEEYSVFFDAETISRHDLYSLLYTVIVSQYDNTPAIDITFHAATETDRVNEAADAANTDHPSVTVSVSTTHPATQIPPSEWVSRIVHSTPVTDLFAATSIPDDCGFTLDECEFTTPELTVTDAGTEITIRTYHSPPSKPTDTAHDDSDILKITVEIQDDTDTIHHAVLEDISTRDRDQAGETWTYANGIINKTEWFT